MPDEKETEKTQKVPTIEIRKERVEELRRKLKELEDFKNIRIVDVYLERFLYGTEFEIEAAYTKMKMFYEAILDHPQWYSKNAPLDYKHLIEKDIRIMLSETDKEGRPIYISKQGNVDVKTMELLDVVAVDDMWLESILSRNPRVTEKGLCVIVDIANYPWGMIKWFTPEYIKNSLKKLQSLPFRDYRFHIVNNSILIHATLKILWPFLPDHIKEMVKFHFNNRDSLLEHIDQQVLPLEYGGTNNVDYNELYDKLFERNDEIHSSLKLHRSLCDKSD